MTSSYASSWSLSPALTNYGFWFGFLAILIAYNLHSYYRLSHVPGPLLQSLSSLGFLKTHLDGSPHYEILKWTQRYGKLYLENSKRGR
jgi:hypothetical protein